MLLKKKVLEGAQWRTTLHIKPQTVVCPNQPRFKTNKGWRVGDRNTPGSQDQHLIQQKWLL